MSVLRVLLRFLFIRGKINLYKSTNLHVSRTDIVKSLGLEYIVINRLHKLISFSVVLLFSILFIKIFKKLVLSNVYDH